ncbi:hypothetical protein D0809_06505 [Flavobacterium circumlabens]|uniref:Uncharacterized protein n=1 Tax=Flavobacterium circumlabens TaxID=2133765 RepID=A0A4Y7UF52_9FLAO|nr:hypothetical protein [Flavobacterium circumlabens]TCN59551.1 hypothetical protein EV142_102169 [Flavobacterium circumlabens]TEB44841.1 hypothetical protein D0809_06505 [Flavobacterium circumlabens]
MIIRIKHFVFTSILLGVLIACEKNEKNENVTATDKLDSESDFTGGTIVFKSGFQGNTIVGPYGTNAQREDIIGLESGNDWTSTLQDGTPFNDFHINYESGNNNDRKASIVMAPNVDPALNAKVLQCEIKNATTCYAPDQSYPNGLCKARIAGELIANPATKPKEYYQKIKVYFPQWETLEQSTAPELYRWFILFEYGNDNDLQNINQAFKASLRITKSIPGNTGPLRFYIKGENCINGGASWSKAWEELNTNFQVPTNTWMTLEIYIKEGNADNGKFYVAVTPTGGKTIVVFNKTGYTYNSSLSKTPDGIEEFNALKLYCSDDVVKAFTSQGRTLKVLFDDLEIWQNRSLKI